MSYLIENAIDDAFIWTHRLSPSVNTGRPEMLVLIRESFQKQFNLALIADPEFFTKKENFVAATSVNYPSGGYRKTVLIEIPAARSGMAPIYEPSEWYRKLNNARSGFTADNPGAKLGQSAFTLSSSLAGDHYYITTFGDSVLDVEATDLETLLPRAFVPGVVLGAALLAKARFYNQSPLRMGAVKMLEEARLSQDAMVMSLYPAVQAQMEQPSPTTTGMQRG